MDSVASMEAGGGGVKLEAEVKVEDGDGVKEEKDDFWTALKEEEESSEEEQETIEYKDEYKSARLRAQLQDVKEGSRPPLSRNGSASGTSTPRASSKASGSAGARVKKEAVPIQRPLIDDLPLAWDEAHETFDVLEACVYETKKMGLSREQDEMMVCDCVYDKRAYTVYLV